LANPQGQFILYNRIIEKFSLSSHKRDII